MQLSWCALYRTWRGALCPAKGPLMLVLAWAMQKSLLAEQLPWEARPKPLCRRSEELGSQPWLYCKSLQLRELPG